MGPTNIGGWQRRLNVRDMSWGAETKAVKAGWPSGSKNGRLQDGAMVHEKMTLHQGTRKFMRGAEGRSAQSAGQR